MILINLARTVIIQVVVAITLIILFEISLKLISPAFFERLKLCGYILCNINYEYQTDFNGTVIYSKDKYGLRGRYKKPEEIDILIVGGSTSDQRYVSNKMTWDNLLEEKLNEDGFEIDIVNAGIDGQSTLGHLWNFSTWFPQIPNLKPKYIAFFIGVNDIMPRESAGFYDNIKSERSFKEKIKDFLKSTLSYYLFRLAKGVWMTQRANVGHSTDRWSWNIISKQNALDIKSYQSNYLEKQFRQRLQKLAIKTREMGSTPIFITQKTGLWKNEKEIVVGLAENNTSAVEPKVFPYQGIDFKFLPADNAIAEKALAEEVMNSCLNMKVKCFDGFSNFKINQETTYDLVHTNNAGSEMISNKLKPFFTSILIQ